MKKSEFNLLKTASKFRNKYAQSQNLQQIIENASSYGENSPNGIMNFLPELQKQKGKLSLKVTVTSGMLGGANVSVSDFTGTDSNGIDIAPQFYKLPGQIKAYLEKHISSFPQIEKGGNLLNWDYRSATTSLAQNP